MTDDNTYDAARVWTNTFPRRVTRNQQWAYSPEEVVDLTSSVEGTGPGYVSVYSFPDGHTKENSVPRIDTLFLDFDIPEGAEEADDWEHDLSKLLVRARKLARVILSQGDPEYWRASLSGNKGIHLFLDFPPVHPDQGTYNQFYNGVNKYANKLTSRFVDLTGVDDLNQYIDATVTGDLGRLTRLPNTIHEKATSAHGEPRYCVPVSIRELADMRVGDYIRLTRKTRGVPQECHRNPNERAHDALVQYIRDSPTERASGASSQPSEYDDKRIAAYKKQSNNNIEVEDLEFVMQKRPCVTEFLDDPERFTHGGESHIMEMKVISELLAEEVPINVIVEAFEKGPDDTFSKKDTLEAIERYISGNFHEPSPPGCSNIWNNSDFFTQRYCIGEDCGVYDRRGQEQQEET